MQAGQRVAVTQAEQRQGGCLCRLQEVIQQSLGGRSCRAALRLRRSVCTLLCTYHRCVRIRRRMSARALRHGTDTHC